MGAYNNNTFDNRIKEINIKNCDGIEAEIKFDYVWVGDDEIFEGKKTFTCKDFKETIEVINEFMNEDNEYFVIV